MTDQPVYMLLRELLAKRKVERLLRERDEVELGIRLKSELSPA